MNFGAHAVLRLALPTLLCATAGGCGDRSARHELAQSNVSLEQRMASLYPSLARLTLDDNDQMYARDIFIAGNLSFVTNNANPDFAMRRLESANAAWERFSSSRSLTIEQTHAVQSMIMYGTLVESAELLNQAFAEQGYDRVAHEDLVALFDIVTEEYARRGIQRNSDGLIVKMGKDE